MYTYKELADTLQLPTAKLNGNLFQVIYGNGAIITKQRKNGNFDKPDETFSLNLNYKNNSIKVNLVPTKTEKKKADADDSKRNDAVEKERNMVAQANIVKIMKTNQGHSVKHTDLVSQTIELCRLFKAQPPMIKSAIEHLLQTGYIRRDEKDRSKYWYIA